jgi:hypothetical protein
MKPMIFGDVDAGTGNPAKKREGRRRAQINSKGNNRA